MVAAPLAKRQGLAFFQYSLCRVVLMVVVVAVSQSLTAKLSVLALSSRFDGHVSSSCTSDLHQNFQYSLCRVVLMVDLFLRLLTMRHYLSVLALSSRFDGRSHCCHL